MEAPNWPESLPSNRKKAIHELVQGQEWTDKLREVLGWSGSTNPDPKLIDELVVQILEMFESTLSIMGSYSVDEQPPLPSTGLHAFCSPKSEKSDESPGTAIPVKMKRGCYKRRKNTWTSTKVTSVLIDDGHAWRKYGQKEILNSKHQRSYYRCTYKLEQGCLATKQVQKMEDKPAYYKITYFGHHTCTNLQRAPPIILDTPDPRDTSILLDFGTKGLNEKKQAGPYFPTMKNEHSMGTPVSSNTYQSWNQSSQIPIESVSMISSRFDHVDMISPEVYSGLDHGDMTRLEPYLPIARTTPGYELEHMIGMNAFIEFPY